MSDVTVRDLIARKLDEARRLAALAGDQDLAARCYSLSCDARLVSPNRAEAETLSLMARFLDACKRDQRTYHDFNKGRGVRNFHAWVWYLKDDVHAQLLKAHGQGWAFPESVHLVLEQRDYWSDEDVYHLLMFAADYLEGKYE